MRTHLLRLLLLTSVTFGAVSVHAEVSAFIRSKPNITVTRDGNAAHVVSGYKGEWVRMYVQKGDDIYVVTHSGRQDAWRSRKLGPDNAAYVKNHLQAYLFPADTQFTVEAGGKVFSYHWDKRHGFESIPDETDATGSPVSVDQDEPSTSIGEQDDEYAEDHDNSTPLGQLPTTGAGQGGGSSGGFGTSSSGGGPISGDGTNIQLTYTSPGGGIVRKYDPVRVKHPKGHTGENGGGGLIENIQLPPADQYYLDYTVMFENEFDWYGNPRGGKLPGLAGGTGTGGCRNIDPRGWSARQVWHGAGEGRLYLYHQNRGTGCGDPTTWKNPDGSTFKFEKNKFYRITQRVKVNTPNQPNGEDQVWVNGVQVAYRNNLTFRGAVAPSEARVSMLKYHSYFGGKSPYAPDYDSYLQYGTLFVMSCTPDFTKPTGTCKP